MFLLTASSLHTAFRRVVPGLVAVAMVLGAAGELRAQADGSLRWPLTTGSTSQRPYINSSPAVGPDGTIYIGVGYDTSPPSGAVFAINRNGTLKAQQFLTPGPVGSSPTVTPDGTTIYVGCDDGNLYALNPDLSKKWAFHALGNSFIDSTPAIGADGTIYFGSGDDGDYANSALYALAPDGTLRWRKTVDGWVESSPVIGPDGTIYFGSWDNNIYACAPDGTKKWRVATNAPVISSAAVAADGTIYIGSTDTYLYALSPEGQTKWTFPTGGSIIAAPVIGVDGTIYVGSTTDFTFYALNPAGPDGSRLKWKFEAQGPFEATAAVRSDGSIIVGSQDDYVRALNPDDGSVRWAYQTGDAVNSSPVVAADGSIYVGSLDGKLYAFNGIASLSTFSSWPMFQRDAMHSGRAHDPNIDGQLLSLSTRAQVTPGNKLIAGFVVQGESGKTLLLRGIGPSLIQHGVADPLADPTLTLATFPGGFILRANDNWDSDGDASQIIAASAAVGAFPLPPGSKDAVIYAATVDPGAYTAIVDSTDNGSGVALVEVYDAAVNITGARLTAISTRGLVGTGENVLIPGFYIGGNGPLRVLVRAVGPGLAAYGVTGVLAQPVLTVYSGQTVIRRNVGWTSDGYKADLAAAAQAVKDFALVDGSADSAMLLTLAPGAYTVPVSGVGGTTGEALVEVYAVP